MKRLNEYFHEDEFVCKHCGTLPPGGMDNTLVTALGDLRARLDTPIKVVSGYRCPEYNAKVGGAKRSQHLLGRAADIRCPDLSDGGLYEILETIEVDPLWFYMFMRGGIGVYPRQQFIHLDVRGEHGGRTARWRG